MICVHGIDTERFCPQCNGIGRVCDIKWPPPRIRVSEADQLRADLSTERTRRERAEREAESVWEQLTKERTRRESAERELDELRANSQWVTADELDHWRTQAADMERARDAAQAEAYRLRESHAVMARELSEARADRDAACGDAERLTIELQSARMPDEVRDTIYVAIRFAEGASWIEEGPAIEAIEWLDATRKDVTNG